MDGTGITPKTIWTIIIVVIVGVVLFIIFGNPRSAVTGLGALADKCTAGVDCAQSGNFQSIGSCRQCVTLNSYNIPFAKDIGEYVDWRMAQKLSQLAQANQTWRVTEAYPPTVKHLSFCHTDGTCVDIGLFASQRNAANLSQLCQDALDVGFTVLNEYSDPAMNSSDTNCPSPNIFETTTGGNLHLQIN